MVKYLVLVFPMLCIGTARKKNARPFYPKKIIWLYTEILKDKFKRAIRNNKFIYLLHQSINSKRVPQFLYAGGKTFFNEIDETPLNFRVT